MTNKAMLKIAVSSLIFGVTLASCSTTGASGNSVNLTEKAEKSLGKGNVQKAIANAEEAVLLAPRDAEARRILAQAYMQEGRFLSAEKTFEDAMAVGDNSARTIISLSMMQIAQGKQTQALQLLDSKKSVLPPSDYGLALALAGETDRGVDVLSGLVRSGVNSPKVRQNLAFAYALDGRWREAKLMAGQDVKPDEVNQRILQWAQLAQPNAYQARVASLIGVAPAKVDSGQPSRLALRPQSDNAVAVALAANAPVNKAAPAFVAPIAESEAAPKPINFASAGPVSVPLPASKPAAEAPANKAAAPKAVANPTSLRKEPIVETVGAARSRTAKAVPTPKISAPAAERSVANGEYIIQLGAFSSSASAKKAWSQMTSKFSELAPFGSASSTVKAKGRTLYRLAATGFGNEESARSMCDLIKSRGGSCIVRKLPGNAASTRLASRR